MNGKTFGEVAREYFPDASNEDVDFILWEHTGYPCFWETNDIEACLRKQLQEFKDECRAYTTIMEVGSES